MARCRGGSTLHHIQRSVFEGHLSPAQITRSRTAMESKINPSYDRVLVYTFPPGAQPERHSWGAHDSQPDDIP
jgi:CRISPR-associated protein Cas2